MHIGSPDLVVDHQKSPVGSVLEWEAEGVKVHVDQLSMKRFQSAVFESKASLRGKEPVETPGIVPAMPVIKE